MTTTAFVFMLIATLTVTTLMVYFLVKLMGKK